MKKLLVGAAMAVSMLAVAPVAANAATYINLPIPAAGADGTISTAFKEDLIPGGSFETYYNFTFPSAGLTTIKVVGGGVNTITNVVFDTVTLNGHAFSLLDLDYAKLSEYLVSSGPQVLYVKGVSGGNGSYAGTLAFAPAGAVPEPATWAMMIIGFTGAGVAIRRRRRDSSVAFA